MRADAGDSAGIIYRIIYRYLYSQVLLMTSPSRSRIEYLLPAGNIIVLD